MKVYIAAFVALCLLVSCSNPVSAPEPQDDLLTRVELQSALVRAGDLVTGTFSITNRGQEALVFTTDFNCVVTARIFRGSEAPEVFPGVCQPAVLQTVVEAGMTFAGDFVLGSDGLSPGRYRIDAAIGFDFDGVQYPTGFATVEILAP